VSGDRRDKDKGKRKKEKGKRMKDAWNYEL